MRTAVTAAIAMTTSSDSHPPQTPVKETSTAKDPILCPHCRRTASNGIKCKGICVADNDY
ncbi:MAG: hypothetical protein ACO36E_07605 [Synechocystis sp.]